LARARDLAKLSDGEIFYIITKGKGNDGRRRTRAGKAALEFGEPGARLSGKRRRRTKIAAATPAP